MTSFYDRRQLLVGGGALAIAGAAFAAEPRRSVVDFSHAKLGGLVPLTIGPWSGADDADVVPEQVDGSIDHGQIVSRSYEGAGVSPVMLVVSYHGPQSPDLKVHRPETCYAVAGFAGGRPRPIDVVVTPSSRVPSVLFTARREQRVETVLYWTRVGNRFPQSLGVQRLDFFREALHGARADGLLVRASVIGPDPTASAAVLQSFAGALVAAASPSGRKLLLGPAGGQMGQMRT